MICGPSILNLSLCFMKGLVIRYTRSALLISVLHSQIVWGGSSYSWTSFFEFRKYQALDIWITIIQIIQNCVEFWPMKAELLLRQISSSHLDWSVRKVCMCGLLGRNGWHSAGEHWI